MTFSKAAVGALVLAAGIVLACRQEPSAAVPAVTALRKLEAATHVGVSYQQYSPLLIDAKAAVEEAQRQLPDGPLKERLTATMDHYEDAGTFWGKTIQGGYEFVIGEPYGLKAKYDFPREGSHGAIYRKDALPIIWAAASKELAQAAELLSGRSKG